MTVYSILEGKKGRPLMVHERTVRPEGIEEEGRLDIDLVGLKMIKFIMIKIITAMIIALMQI